MLDVVAAMREPNESSSARHDAEAQPSERIQEPRARRKRRRNVLLLLLGLLVVGVCGGMLWRHFSSYETTDDAQVDAHLYPVSARVHGYVIRVNVDDNEYVQQGTLLVEIDPRDYEVAVDQARADLANAEATAQSLHIDVPITATNTSSQLQSTAADVEKGEAGIVAAQKQLAAAEAQLQQDQANDVKAQHDLARYQMLVEKEEVSRQVYDSALAAARASAAAVNAGAANVESARQSVEQARSVLTSAQAGHRAAPGRCDSCAGGLGGSSGEAEARSSRAGGVEPCLHQDHGSCRRSGSENGRGGNECSAGPTIADDGSSPGRVGDC
jgi:membrane fusion protein, multidrug efflux system